MTHSMTAFARGEHEFDWGTASWELRSVNHRYLDVSLRMPEDFRALEATVRERLTGALKRGKVEGNLRVNQRALEESNITLNTALVQQLKNAAERLAEMVPSATALSTAELLRWPGVIEPPSIDSESIKTAVLETLDATIEDFVSFRAREGAQISRLIDERCQTVCDISALVRTDLPRLLDAQRQKLIDRVQEICNEVDAERIELEIALLAQKADVAEELDRLDTHIEEVRRLIGSKSANRKPMGRRLDFLMQELNREANTLGSKSINVATTNASIDLKVAIEQMREQVQNIE
jgi:uncharacterized protein (TIGR00255 family)